MAPDLSLTQIGAALTRLGHYRVMAAQAVALEGAPDGISGALLLSLGLRETGLRNINNPSDTDHGCFQISELYHWGWLAKQPGCKEGEWTVSPGHSAVEDGYCPRYTPALEYAIDVLHTGLEYARVKRLPEIARISFAVASYNAGVGGAMNGYKAGDVDRYTTGLDYSSWVLRHRTMVNQWLRDHPNWRVP